MYSSVISIYADNNPHILIDNFDVYSLEVYDDLDDELLSDDAVEETLDDGSFDESLNDGEGNS
jgi:hypothetical protein